MGTAPAFASVSEAMEMVRAGLAFVAAADAAELTTEEQAECLRQMERSNSALTAARTSVLGVFTTGRGYSADADYSPRAWLIHKTGITRGAAVSYTAWEKRAGRHPRVFAVLAADGEVSESFARTICVWTDKLPAGSRDAADGRYMSCSISASGAARWCSPPWPASPIPPPIRRDGRRKVRARQNARYPVGIGNLPRGSFCRPARKTWLE